MLTTAWRLLATAALLAILAGALRDLFWSPILGLAAGVVGLLAWSAFCLHVRDAGKPRPRAPIVRWQDGPTQTVGNPTAMSTKDVGNPTGISAQPLGQFNRRPR